MKINKLKINSFGNLNNKELELSDNINIIYGKNESGKSTLLKFIVNMFYGISKNKKGKEFSDYDKFNPWNNEEFSGKITYRLDNGEKYEVFRDFNKKNPKIYNELSEDISKNYNIDKLNGNQFFIDQTNINENLFLSTLVSMQQSVKLDKQTQNELIQKVANFINTGDDNISYKNALEKINKKQLEEIGTSRSQERPINIINEKIEKIENEKKELINLKDKPYEIEEIKNNLKNKIIENENKLEIIKEINLLKDKQKIENEKINLNKKLILENKNEIILLENKKEEINNEIIENEKNINLEYDNNILNNKNEKLEKKLKKLEKQNKRTKIFFTVVEIVLVVLTIINFMLIKNSFVQKILLSIIPLTCIGFLLVIFSVKKLINNLKSEIKENSQLSISQKNEENETLKSELHNIEIKVDLIQKNIEKQNIEIKKIEQENKNNWLIEEEKIINNYINKLNIQNNYLLNEKINNEKNNLEKIKYEINNYFNTENLNEEINLLENNLNKYKLEIHSLEIDENNLIPKLEKLSLLEEELVNLYENKNELLKENESIELTKEILEIAYNKMKNNVTPKFATNLSSIIEKISNGKYKNVKVNDEEGILIERQNGEYIQIEKLSTGTIEQLYLALRFSFINELTKETMPIILDESFAYYDEERLSNILKYLNEYFKNNQIIILTCTDREMNILNNENIKYNLIKL